MIPLRDVIPSRSTPFVTLSLIALTTLVWLIELTQQPATLAHAFQDYGVVPARFRSGALVTAPFLHASWLHVVGNMWCLWIFGENVETRIGRAGFALFYLSCGTVAGLGHLVSDSSSQVPLVGSSGAVAGVLGAYLVLYPSSRVLAVAPRVVSWDLVEIPAVVLLGAWFLLQLVGTGAVAPTAHTHDPELAFATYLVAFLVGAACMLATGRRRLPRGWWSRI